jgi:hypothetical protein
MGLKRTTALMAAKINGFKRFAQDLLFFVLNMLTFV